jgi:ankyrin repeat protein
VGAPALEIDAQGPYNGFTPLHDAVWHGHLVAARALVDAGARLNLKTHAGLTPRGLAVLYGYEPSRNSSPRPSAVDLRGGRPIDSRNAREHAHGGDATHFHQEPGP